MMSPDLSFAKKSEGLAPCEKLAVHQENKMLNQDVTTGPYRIFLSEMQSYFVAPPNLDPGACLS